MGFMKTILLFVALAVLLSGLYFLFKPRQAPLYSVPVSDIPAVISKLHGLPTGRYGTWAVFMFKPSGASPEEDAVNLQYSVENGVVGLDWVLISGRNVADKDKLVTFISAKGFTASELEMNKVRYLRIVGNGIELLGVTIVTDFYGIPAHTPLDFHTEGFEWSKT